MRRLWAAVRHPGAWLQGICAGESAYPLVILFCFNAVDEFDRAAFGILLPEIRDSFGLDLSAMLAIVALSSVAALALQVPIAQIADRRKRVPLAIAGAVVWACFSGLTGLATGLVMLTVARSGSAIGKAVIDPTHNSLLADYYPIAARGRVYSTHRAANAVGAFVGPLTAGLLAFNFGWRAPFLVFVFPTMIVAVLAMRMHEPVRGRWEREAAGASADVIGTEEPVPSFAESWRIAHKVPTLRRIWWSLPFLAVSLVGFVVLAALMYEQEFGLDERARGVAAAIAEPFQLVGIVYGARIALRRYAGDFAGLLRFLASIAMATSVASVAFALAPNIVVAVAVNCVISAALATIAPGILALLSLAIPPRARATGFSIASLWAIPGLLILPFVGWLADVWTIRVGMLAMVPMFVIGSLILRSASGLIVDDVAEVWRSTAARSEALFQRRSGESELLIVRKLDAGYGDRRVLFGVDIDVREGQIVALLGTNGAGKSTLLKAISGVVEADRGAIVLDGRDITHAPPNEIAHLGIAQMPGGAAVFGSLTVAENLQLAGWTRDGDDDLRADTDEVLAMFPVLADRLHAAAADLSGGQQQMLALAMAFVARPRVLLIDELSLGLAPVVVGEMLPVVQRIAAAGVAVVLVEQSVNVALTIADRAYFMERGEIRFSGPASELMDRPDLLRSVFLSQVASGDTRTGNGERSVPDRVASLELGAPPKRSGGGELGRRSEQLACERSSALTVEGLVRSFGGIRAVDHASFEVHEREIVGIIGPNGAGKTTIFDLVSGFTPLDAGRIVLAGRDITHASPSRRAAAGLGRSFQDALMFPEMTVRETLQVACERWVESRSVLAAALRLPMSFDDEQRLAGRADELMELMGLGRFRDSFVRELSTGTRRILDLACQVAHRPAVILLDEPSSGIAQREVEALAPVLRRLRDEMGAALVVIEHDIPLVSSVADRLVALELGRVIATGEPEAVLQHPDVVESYLGTSAAALQRSGTRG
jgi:ABC-type branched-subunit amino acid transport system ATPase component/MFS family permease